MQTDPRLPVSTTYEPAWVIAYYSYRPAGYVNLREVLLQVWAPVEEAQRKLEQASDPGD